MPGLFYYEVATLVCFVGILALQRRGYRRVVAKLDFIIAVLEHTQSPAIAQATAKLRSSSEALQSEIDKYKDKL